MNWGIVEQVFLKDLQELSKNRYVFYSMLFLPVLLVSITIINIDSAVSSTPVSITEITVLISTFSEIIILIPAIVSVLIGSTSVVIEKNNRSLEPLLATPITDSELLMGKALAPFIPAMILGYAAYGVCDSCRRFSDLSSFPGVHLADEHNAVPDVRDGAISRALRYFRSAVHFYKDKGCQGCAAGLDSINHAAVPGPHNRISRFCLDL